MVLDLGLQHEVPVGPAHPVQIIKDDQSHILRKNV